MSIYRDDLLRLFPRLSNPLHKLLLVNRFGPTKNYHALKQFCEERNIPWVDGKESELLWRIYHGDFSPKSCDHCGSDVRFLNFSYGFREYCSTKCSAIARDNSTRGGFVTKEGQEKSRDTLEKKYGVRHQMQVSVFHERQQKKRYKSYKVTSPAGNEYTVQGYERFVIHDLWAEYGEDDVVCRKQEIPKFWYVDDAGVRRRYYPDFFVLSKNMIVEVKSTFTIKADKGLTRFKKDAVEQAGYKFDLVVYDEKMGRVSSS